MSSPTLVGVPEWARCVASIQYEAASSHRYGWHCATGALITRRMVITNARSFRPAAPGHGIPLVEKAFTARIGSTTFGAGVPYDIVGVYVHPGFDPDTGEHDLAIAVLRDPAWFTPLLPLDSAPMADREAMTVLGWPRGEDGYAALTRFRTLVTTHLRGGLVNLSGEDDLGDEGYTGAPVIRLDHDGAPHLCGVVSRRVDRPYEVPGPPPVLAVGTAAGDDAAFIRHVLCADKPCRHGFNHPPADR
jgi:hypothetical protein